MGPGARGARAAAGRGVRLWLRYLRARGVATDRVRFRLSIHESADVPNAVAYWAGVLGIEPDELGAPVLKRHRPRTNRRNTGPAYVGCLSVRVLQSRVLYQEVAGAWTGIVAALGHGPVADSSPGTPSALV